MGSKVHIPADCLYFLLLFAASTSIAGPVGEAVGGTGSFDIMKYGAKGDGKSDDSKALLDAWKEACKAPGDSKILIPKGTFLMNSVTLEGPCSGSLNLIVEGTVQAPAELAAMISDSLFTINHVDQFKLNGGGSLDGQGQQAWKQNECSTKRDCKQLPINLRLNFVTNSVIENIKSLNSKNFHVNIISCKNLTIQRLGIEAPAESLNTDGIHIARSSSVHIVDTHIATGDDCISIGDEMQDLYITGVTCGPGHGISIGSLGGSPNEKPVNGIYVQNCTITGTENGVRIKTWPDKFTGSVSNVHFEDIIMDNVANPIIIDQGYCPHNLCNKGASSNVKLSNINYKNIRGTSSTQLAVNLVCSSGLPCESVELSNIDLKMTGGGSVISQATNVKPKVTGTLNPAFTNP